MHRDAGQTDLVSAASDTVLRVLRTHADHPSALLAINRDTLRFSADGIEGFIAYRPAGRRHLVMVAGVSAAAGRADELLDRFLAWAAGERRQVVAVQILRDDAERFARRGFRVNQIGASYGITLAGFALAGTRFIKLRNKISRARRCGIVVAELGKDVALVPDVRHAIEEIDRQWIKEKGTRELEFLVGETGQLDEIDGSLRRIFVALREGIPVAYILYTASFGRYAGWMHDLSRRLPDAPAGVMELINSRAIEIFKAEGAKMLNFGFTPLTSLAPEHELPGSWHRMTAWGFAQLAAHGSFIYPAQTQLQYKMKWSPDVVLPEYVAFQKGGTLSGLWRFLRLTRAI
jgi:lysylphosphatidylglycerol synthetase-like protein (DUF2156 family)